MRYAVVQRVRLFARDIRGFDRIAQKILGALGEK